MTSVSVVIPTHDRPAMVRRAAAVALDQRGVDVQVVVVDDGSSPSATASPGVQLVRHDAARGVAQARNAGIAAGEGEWVAFLDDDDVWAPDKLIRQVRAVEETGADLSYCRVVVIDVDGRPGGDLDFPAWDVARSSLRRYNAIPAGASNVLVRRALLDEVGGFDPSLAHFADWDLWLRLAQAGSGAPCDAPLVGYVQHPGAMHVADVRSARSELVRFEEKHAQRPTALALNRPILEQWMAEGHAVPQRNRASELRRALRHAARNVRREPVSSDPHAWIRAAMQA